MAPNKNQNMQNLLIRIDDSNSPSKLFDDYEELFVFLTVHRAEQPTRELALGKFDPEGELFTKKEGIDLSEEICTNSWTIARAKKLYKLLGKLMGTPSAQADSFLKTLCATGMDFLHELTNPLHLTVS